MILTKEDIVSILEAPRATTLRGAVTKNYLNKFMNLVDSTDIKFACDEAGISTRGYQILHSIIKDGLQREGLRENLFPTPRKIKLAEKIWNEDILHHIDIVIAFLNGEVYVTQPRNFVKKGQEDKVCKCHKALYGLKQSPRAWYEKADRHLVKRGFCNSPTKSTLYVKRQGDVLLIVVLYVDDLLIIGPNEGHIAEFMADLNATFKMKDLGLLHHYLGIQLMQCDGGIDLCPKSYIKILLCKFGLEDCKPIATPMETDLKLSLYDAGDPANVPLYQTVVGCLIYVCKSGPGIQFAISHVSRFMHSLGSKHWKVVKRIFCYLSGTLHLGLFYPKGGSLLLRAGMRSRRGVASTPPCRSSSQATRQTNLPNDGGTT
ncbi:hypothetical protein L7F22_022078 [Adiantum nelumboides]|nr:hypothetical protein [Adiantum nelumboides]